MSAASRKYMSKRQRPCDFCRSRKSACRIEGYPPCRLCALHGRECTFVEGTQPRRKANTDRGREEESFSPHTPQLYVNDNSNNDGGDTNMNSFSGRNHFTDPEMQQLMERTSTPCQMHDDSFMHFLAHDERAEPTNTRENNHEDFAGITLPEDFFMDIGIDHSPEEFGLRTIQTRLDTNDGPNPQTLGSSTDMDPYLLRHYRFDDHGMFNFKSLSIQTVDRGSLPMQFLLSRPELFSSSRQELGLRQLPYDVAKKELETLVSPDTGHRLILLFRTFILPQIPIFSEVEFPNPDKSPPYVLAALYLIAQDFIRFDEVLSIELAYEGINTQALSKFIDGQLRFELHDPSIAVVQTLVMLLIRPSRNPLVLESSFTWSLHSTLVSASQTLGLHYDPSSWNITKWQVTLRRRISCVIYTMDKWLACSLGRPPLISKNSWLVTTLTGEDGYAGTLTTDLWLDYIHFARLGSTMGDVLECLYSLRAVAELTADFETTMNISRDLLEQLSRWKQDQNQRTHSHEEPAVLSVLQDLGYHYTRMTIYRAIIRPSIQHDTLLTIPTVFTEGLSDAGQSRLESAKAELRSSTTAAASFIQGLRDAHIRILWPTWCQSAFSSICFLSLLMAASASSKEEALVWFQDLLATRKEMRVKSATLPILRLGLLRIDALFWKGLDKVLHLPSHVQEALVSSLKPNTY